MLLRARAMIMNTGANNSGCNGRRAGSPVVSATTRRDPAEAVAFIRNHWLTFSTPIWPICFPQPHLRAGCSMSISVALVLWVLE